MTLVTSYSVLKQGIFSFHDFAKMSSSLFLGKTSLSSDSLVFANKILSSTKASFALIKYRYVNCFF